MVREFAVVFAAMAVLTGFAPANSAQTPPADVDCDVSVAFGSYDAEIDQRTYARVLAWLNRHANLVAQVTVTPWGSQGETTVCVTASSEKVLKRLFTGLLRQLPRSRQKAPVFVFTRTEIDLPSDDPVKDRMPRDNGQPQLAPPDR